MKPYQIEIAMTDEAAAEIEAFCNSEHYAITDFFAAVISRGIKDMGSYTVEVIETTPAAETILDSVQRIENEHLLNANTSTSHMPREYTQEECLQMLRDLDDDSINYDVMVARWKLGDGGINKQISDRLAAAIKRQKQAVAGAAAKAGGRRT